ncbi:MAG: macro domain-containing protein [Epsilonproteobacteria bacterium]|nr:macro domain-containing protein [Campylobacterota bacterium]
MKKNSFLVVAIFCVASLPSLNAQHSTLEFAEVAAAGLAGIAEFRAALEQEEKPAEQCRKEYALAHGLHAAYNVLALCNYSDGDKDIDGRHAIGHGVCAGFDVLFCLINGLKGDPDKQMDVKDDQWIATGVHDYSLVALSTACSMIAAACNHPEKDYWKRHVAQDCYALARVLRMASKKRDNKPVLFIALAEAAYMLKRLIEDFRADGKNDLVEQLYQHIESSKAPLRIVVGETDLSKVDRKLRLIEKFDDISVNRPVAGRSGSIVDYAKGCGLEQDLLTRLEKLNGRKAKSNGGGSGPVPGKGPVDKNEEVFDKPFIYNGVQLVLIKGNMVTMKFDNPATAAIVNAAKPTLAGGGGIDGAIHSAAESSELVAYNSQNNAGHCDVGKAKWSPAFGLSRNGVVDNIIHTVGPHGTDSDREQKLIDAYQNSLALAAQKDIAEIAFVPISTNNYGYNISEATPVALNAIKDWINANGADKVKKIYFVIFNDGPAANLYKDQMQGIFK